MTIKINVLIVKNSFLTKTADAKTRYKTQHTSQLVRKTNKYIKSLKCLLASTCFVFLFNSANLELAAILKTTTIKKAGIYRYATHERYMRKISHSGPGCSDVWILRVFWFSLKHPCPYNKYMYIYVYIYQGPVV